MKHPCIAYTNTYEQYFVHGCSKRPLKINFEQIKKRLVNILFLIAVLFPKSIFCQYKEEIKEIVYHLASPELQGRLTGSMGQKKAAGYISNYFKNNKLLNIKNEYDSVDYMQHFDLIGFKHQAIVYAIRKQDTLKINNALSFKNTNINRSFYLDSANVVYAENNQMLQNLADTMATYGKPVVVVLPGNMFEIYYSLINSIKFFSKDSIQITLNLKAFSTYSAILTRLLERFSNADSRDVVLLSYNEIIRRNIAVGISDKDRNNKLYFNPGLKFSIKGQLKKNITETENVVSVVKAKNKDKPWLIIGAHYDHLGITGKHIYYGADDNASGVAALMVLSKYFANNNKTDYNLMFIAFSGEELGLLGSKFFSNSKEMPENVFAMINMDMIGRPDQDKYKGKYVYVLFGGKKSNIIKKRMIKQKTDGLRVTKRAPLKQRFLYTFSSDHYSFYRKNIPIAVLFTGLHDDYHKPTDTPDKLDYDNIENIVIWLTKAIEAL